MRKNGFTLIELLAVMVVLSVILLAVVPLVLRTVKNSKQSARIASVELYGKAIKNAIAEYNLNHNGHGTNNIENLNIKYDGDVICEVTAINRQGEVYLTKCKDHGKKVKDKDGSDYSYGREFKPDICKITSGDGTNVGDEITCGTESFYVLEANEDEIKTLAKQGLDYYNKQNSNPYVIRYSNSSNNTTYRGSNAENKVINYVTELQNLGIEDAKATLITMDELTKLGCNYSSCAQSGYSWLYSPYQYSSYWTQTAYSSNMVYRIAANGDVTRDYVTNNNYIRPVVTIPVTELLDKKEES